MTRRFWGLVAMMFLAIATLVSLPTPANAAGFFNQSPQTQAASQTPQADQYAQQQSSPQTAQTAQTQQSYPQQGNSDRAANNQSNQPVEAGESAQQTQAQQPQTQQPQTQKASQNSQ